MERRAPRHRRRRDRSRPGRCPPAATTSAAAMPARSTTSSSEIAPGAAERSAAGLDDRHPSRGPTQLLARNAQHPGRRARRCRPSRPDRVSPLAHLGGRRSVEGRRQRRRRQTQIRRRLRHRWLLRPQGYTKLDSTSATTRGANSGERSRQPASTRARSPVAVEPETSTNRNRSARWRSHRARRNRGAKRSTSPASESSSSTLPETTVGRAQAKSSG